MVNKGEIKMLKRKSKKSNINEENQLKTNEENKVKGKSNL